MQSRGRAWFSQDGGEDCAAEGGGQQEQGDRRGAEGGEQGEPGEQSECVLGDVVECHGCSVIPLPRCRWGIGCRRVRVYGRGAVVPAGDSMVVVSVGEGVFVFIG